MCAPREAERRATAGVCDIAHANARQQRAEARIVRALTPEEGVRRLHAFPSTRSGVTEEQRDGQEPRTLICGRSAHLRTAGLRTPVRFLLDPRWRRLHASATAVRVKTFSFVVAAGNRARSVRRRLLGEQERRCRARRRDVPDGRRRAGPDPASYPVVVIGAEPQRTGDRRQGVSRARRTSRTCRAGSRTPRTRRSIGTAAAAEHASPVARARTRRSPTTSPR